MNSYAVIVLVALLAEYALSLVASLLTIQSLSPDLPAELRDMRDPSTYARTQDYTRVRTRFRLVSSTVNLAALLGFWQVGGFDWFDQLVSRVGFGPVRTGLLYIGGLALGSSLLHVPFTLYATFVIEERFGFNRTNARTFWGDIAKGLLLAVVLGGLLLGAILFFFERAGGSAWLWCWGVVTVFGLVTHFIAPTWIMPLFNTFTPLETGELREAILAYARAVAFPLEGIFVIDGSRRSTKANAFFTGFGKHKRIALFDTLLKKQTTPELVAIVAHEVGHYKRKHVPEEHGDRGSPTLARSSGYSPSSWEAGHSSMRSSWKSCPSMPGWCSSACSSRRSRWCCRSSLTPTRGSTSSRQTSSRRSRPGSPSR